MVFRPSMDQFAPDGFCPLVEGIVEKIFKFASLVPRVASHIDFQQDYLVDVEEVCAEGSCIISGEKLKCGSVYNRFWLD